VSKIRRALGAARSLVNVGAGAGSYEPDDLVRRDLESGVWDERHGHLRQLDSFDAGLRLIATEIDRHP
jgi:hypothetical protein